MSKKKIKEVTTVCTAQITFIYHRISTEPIKNHDTIAKFFEKTLGVDDVKVVRIKDFLGKDAVTRIITAKITDTCCVSGDEFSGVDERSLANDIKSDLFADNVIITKCQHFVMDK